MHKNDGKFYTNGAEAFLRAKHYAYMNAKCTLEKFYMNFFEGANSFDDLDFEEVKNYLDCVIDDFEAFEKLVELCVKFEDISKVEKEDEC